jgi:hypothetical protein
LKEIIKKKYKILILYIIPKMMIDQSLRDHKIDLGSKEKSLDTTNQKLIKPEEITLEVPITLHCKALLRSSLGLKTNLSTDDFYKLN